MLSDTARRFIALFEERTETTAHNCLVFNDQVVFLIAAGDMAAVISPDGRTVRSIERQLGQAVELVEDADTLGAFVTDMLVPAAVRYITLPRQSDTAAYVKVVEVDRGVAIGTGGKTIDTTHELACRHYDTDDIQLT